VLFLELVRQAHDAERLVFRWARDKNALTLAALGWLPADMFAHVARLRPEQALGAVRRNMNPSHPDELVCEFGTQVKGRAIYAKVTIAGLEGGAAGCVVSFHFAEKPLTFPFAR
jgi:hypothetical protein